MIFSARFLHIQHTTAVLEPLGRQVEAGVIGQEKTMRMSQVQK